MKNMTTEELIDLIGRSEKRTPVVAFLEIDGKVDFGRLETFGQGEFAVAFGEKSDLDDVLKKFHTAVKAQKVFCLANGSALPLSDVSRFSARIEPFAVLREPCEVGKGAVVMMGAVINVGAEIGDGTMIDMNAVVGARAKIGKNCHVGAGAVVAGVLEPPSAQPVRVGDGVTIGANAVLLEGVTIGNGAVVAAGAVVAEDVPENAVVAGMPAKIVKYADVKTREKTRIVKKLRMGAEKP